MLSLPTTGTYPEVISVAAVDCNNKLATFSQKHASVDISAPGVDILSTASRQLPSKAGMVKAAFRVDGSGPRFMTNAGIGGTNSQIRYSGLGQASGKVVDCGDGSKACPEAKGNICMVQWDPKMKNVEGKTAGSSMRGRLLRWIDSVAGPRQRPAERDSSNGASGIPPPVTAPPPPNQMPMPTRFTCDLMEFCLQQGAKAALLAAPAPSSGYYPDWGWSKGASGEPEFAEWPFFANLKCTAYNCSCWDRLKGKSILPAAGLTLKQYKDLKAAVKANSELKGTVESQVGLFGVVVVVVCWRAVESVGGCCVHVHVACVHVWLCMNACRRCCCLYVITALLLLTTLHPVCLPVCLYLYPSRSLTCTSGYQAPAWQCLT